MKHQVVVVRKRKTPGRAGQTRRGARTAWQEAGNRRVSKRRVVVEHGIGKMKGWRIATERYRNRRRGHTLTMKNVAGLHDRMFG